VKFNEESTERKLIGVVGAGADHPDPPQPGAHGGERASYGSVALYRCKRATQKRRARPRTGEWVHEGEGAHRGKLEARRQSKNELPLLSDFQNDGATIENTSTSADPVSF